MIDHYKLQVAQGELAIAACLGDGEPLGTGNEKTEHCHWTTLVSQEYHHTLTSI